MNTPRPTHLGTRFVTILSAVLVVATALSGTTAAQRSKITAEPAPASVVERTAPTPIFISGSSNITCGDLNASTDPALAHITTNWEQKFLQPIAVGNTTQDLATGIGGGMPPNANMSNTINAGPANTTMNWWQLQWTSAASLDRLVSAVIVKAGSDGKHVYPYPTLSAGDVGPFIVPSGRQQISHITFCFEPFSAPSAAPGTVSGRILTAGGAPISGASLMIQDLSTGQVRTTTTNSFGRYSFRGLAVTDFYALTVSHRRYSFPEATQFFTLDADLTNMDFVSGN